MRFSDGIGPDSEPCFILNFTTSFSYVATVGVMAAYNGVAAFNASGISNYSSLSAR